MYRVLYKPHSGGYQMSDEMTLEDAKAFRDKCLKMYYPKRKRSYYTDNWVAGRITDLVKNLLKNKKSTIGKV